MRPLLYWNDSYVISYVVYFIFQSHDLTHMTAYPTERKRGCICAVTKTTKPVAHIVYTWTSTVIEPMQYIMPYDISLSYTDFEDFHRTASFTHIARPI